MSVELDTTRMIDVDAIVPAFEIIRDAMGPTQVGWEHHVEYTASDGTRVLITLKMSETKPRARRDAE